MTTHEEALKKFRKEYFKPLNENPQLAALLENIFNFGFSEGAEWMVEQLNKKK